MKKAKIFGILSILAFATLVFVNASIGNAMYEQSSNVAYRTEDIHETLYAPDTFNTSFLNDVRYDPSVSKDTTLKWKVKNYERTDNFNIAEGDKNLKAGDTINLLIGSNPYLQLPNVDAWCQIYVNDVMARYPNVATQIQAFFKYVQPIYLDLFENGINYTQESYFYYLETSPYVNQSYWTFEEDTVTYSYTSITEINNITEITLVYDRDSALMNEMYYSARFTNGTNHFAGANFTLQRTHGWGLPYNISTLVVWIPLLVIVVALIVALRMHLFQRFKLYLEARKLAKRE